MEVTINIPQIVRVTHRSACIGDITGVVCGNADLVRRLEKTPFYVFPEKKDTKVVFDTTVIVSKILQEDSSLTVNNLGEAAFIVEYQADKEPPMWWQWCKVAFVSLIIFFGSAFSILTFHYDVGLESVFSRIYGFADLVSPSFPALEIGYCIGLPLGVLMFFDHFRRSKAVSDPTPLKVQMRSYEKEVNTAIIANAVRDGKEKDNA